MAKKKKKTLTIANSMKLAAKHLAKVQAARKGPDWDDLSIYGLYCLEALVRAATLKSGGQVEMQSHWRKADQAKAFSKKHGLPDIQALMQLLNEARKSEAYDDDDDFDESDHDAGDIAEKIKAYFDAVTKFVT